jgi:hypothetical protein
MYPPPKFREKGDRYLNPFTLTPKNMGLRQHSSEVSFLVNPNLLYHSMMTAG